MMKLYELTEAYQNIIDLDLEEEDLQVALESLNQSVEEKAKGIAMVMRQLEAEAAACKAEIDRIKKLEQKAKDKQSRLKDYLAFNLETLEIKKLDTDIFKFSFRKSESVNVLDESLIPDTFKKEKVTVSVDKTELKKAIKDGVEVPGATLEVKQNLQIK